MDTLPWIRRVGIWKALVTVFLSNAIGSKDVLNIEYNDSQSMPQNCVVRALLRKQKHYSSNCRAKLDHRLKGIPHSFEACLCGSLYSSFKNFFNESFLQYAFCKKRFQTIFIDQLIQSRQCVPLNDGMILKILMILNVVLEVFVLSKLVGTTMSKFDQGTIVD